MGTMAPYPRAHCPLQTMPGMDQIARALISIESATTTRFSSPTDWRHGLRSAAGERANSAWETKSSLAQHTSAAWHAGHTKSNCGCGAQNDAAGLPVAHPQSGLPRTLIDYKAVSAKKMRPRPDTVPASPAPPRQLGVGPGGSVPGNTCEGKCPNVRKPTDGCALIILPRNRCTVCIPLKVINAEAEIDPVHTVGNEP